jgi:hypothetical protein
MYVLVHRFRSICFRTSEQRRGEGRRIEASHLGSTSAPHLIVERAPRALLGWSQQQLADKAIVSLNAVTQVGKAKVE